MDRPDRFAFSGGLGDELRQGLPPIIGSEGGSTWFGGAGHMAGREFPLSTSDEFYLGLDVQADTPTPQLVLGVVWKTSAFLVQVHEPSRGIIALRVRDDEGRELAAQGEGSAAAARRVLIVGQRSSNRVAMYEIQPWAAQPAAQLAVEIVRAESPQSWPMAEAGLAVGGALVDGTHQSGYDGRVAEFFIGDKALGEARVQALAAATDNPSVLSFDKLGIPSEDLRIRFRRDLKRLRDWITESRTTDEDLDDASLILYRWLFDKHPVLVDLAAKLGVQLWLPAMTDHERRYLDLVLADKPTFQMAGVLGPDSAFGFQWRPVSAWRTDPAFHTNGHPVSHEAFIKFVRNKLGPGHFDEEERTRWQKELLGLTAGLRLMGQDALIYQMRAIAETVLLAVAVSRLEALTEG